jgi:hypothetical protein
MGLSLEAGTIVNFSGSMAEEMANAFLAEWDAAMGPNPPPKPDMNNQMRLMFVAIAQGVVKHLKENPNAFGVTVTDGINTFTGTVTGVTGTP